MTVKLPCRSPLGQYESKPRVWDQVFLKSLIIEMFAGSVSLTGFEDQIGKCLHVQGQMQTLSVRSSLLTVIDR